jgi:hypothetical protein
MYMVVDIAPLESLWPTSLSYSRLTEQDSLFSTRGLPHPRNAISSNRRFQDAVFFFFFLILIIPGGSVWIGAKTVCTVSWDISTHVASRVRYPCLQD